ncbi:hypothetical protein [Nocardia arthritidis]|uniref:HTH cro/C1-type domain-containing protein n=1 Tax=Nocardia arthritidis TaxID=228602 RepID=A0A6G9YKA7_9NOCA|nr:hypothetical protein [Nocardia arthritidis]QIS13590.1 hypothetical protein F5544_28695 [Nocardia arthritidis]
MPRPERPLAGDGPQVRFAAELRRLRVAAGSPPYRELARRAHYSAGSLSDAAGGRQLPSLALTLAYVRACGGDVAQWERRWHTAAAAIAAAEHDTSPEAAAAENGGAAPYVGLTAFQPEDADRFFGRRELIDELAEQLTRHRFVAVFGASGAGKSSLLRAGLIPRLRAEAEPPTLVLMTPGAHPLEECAIQFARPCGATPGPLRDELAAEPRGLHRLVRQALVDRSPAAELVLVVDQFEEVFTLCHDAGERIGFINALLTAADADGSRCRIVIGVRADFYAHCTTIPELAAALARAQVVVGPMTTDQLRQAIVGPATAAGIAVEGALLATLIGQATGQAGTLPLLSHALLETWRRRRGNTLTLNGFQATGGIDGALTKTAEAFYGGLTERQQSVTRNLLLRMTAPGAGTEDTKRRITRAELDGADPDVEIVLDRLAKARLVTLDADTAEIAHESLIRAWPRLRGWLAEEREGLRIHRQLTESAAAWAELGEEPHALYRGTRLAVAADWAANTAIEPTPRERRFLDSSLAAQAARRRAAARRTRRLRQLLALLTVLFLVSAGATVFAVRAERTVTGQRNIALSQKVSADADDLRGTDPALAAQLGLAAYRLTPTIEAASGVLETFAAPYATRLTGHTAHVDYVSVSHDGKTMASTSQDRTTRLWDIADPDHPTALATITAHSDTVGRAAFAPGDRILATPGEDDSIQLWDLADRRAPAPLARLTGYTDLVHGVAFSPDGHLLASAGADRTVRIWDVTDPRAPHQLSALTGHTGGIRAVAFAPDGRTVATASEDHTAGLWDITDPRAPRRRSLLVGHTDPVMSVAFAPDGRTVATASVDRTARLWNVADPAAPLATLTGHTDSVRSVDFAPDGRGLVTASHDHTARLWDITDPRAPSTLSILGGHTDFVTSAAFSPDGKRLVTASADRTVRLWQLPGPVLAGHSDFVFGVAYSRDGRTMTTTSQDHTARLWDTTDPRRPMPLSVLTGHTDNVYGAAISPDGRLLATTSEDNTARLWDITDRAHPVTVGVATGHTRNPDGVAFSPDGRILATTSDDRTVRLWDVTDPRNPVTVAVLTGHTDVVWSAEFSPDGHLLATTSDDNTARLWDVTDPHDPVLRARITDHTNAVRSAVFSPDGHTLATASIDRTARLWDVIDPAHPVNLAVLNGHSDGLYTVAFSPDGNTLATAGGDHTVRLWDVRDRRDPTVRAVLDGHTDRIHHLLFAPDGHTLVSTSRDKTFRLWETDIDRAAKRICQIAYPAVTPEEWGRHFLGLPYRPPC